MFLKKMILVPSAAGMNVFLVLQRLQARAPAYPAERWFDVFPAVRTATVNDCFPMGLVRFVRPSEIHGNYFMHHSFMRFFINARRQAFSSSGLIFVDLWSVFRAGAVREGPGTNMVGNRPKIDQI